LNSIFVVSGALESDRLKVRVTNIPDAENKTYPLTLNFKQKDVHVNAYEYLNKNGTPGNVTELVASGGLDNIDTSDALYVSQTITLMKAADDVGTVAFTMVSSLF
jgi:hypothetical protein